MATEEEIMSDFKIEWDEAAGSSDWVHKAVTDVLGGLGWSVLWRKARGTEATPVLEAVPHGDAILAVTLNPGFSARCGYVIAPVDRLAPEVASAFAPGMGDPMDADAISDMHVHGGVTYAKAVPAEELSLLSTGGVPVAVIGFDCLHAGDGSDADAARALGLPCSRILDLESHVGDERRKFGLSGHTWSDEEVLTECRCLARQALAEPPRA